MIKSRLKHFAGRYPWIFFPFYRALGPKKNQKLLFAEDTELVIEGFPRSANTFAVVAFKQAQTRPVKLAHHLHIEAQLIKAASARRPALALIRQPEDCIRSLLIRHPQTPLKWAINRYVQFYEAVGKLGDDCLIVPYEMAINDMGKVVKRINEKFHTDFSIPTDGESMVRNVFREIEEINRELDGGKESHVARPSDERAKLSRAVDLSLHGKEIKKARDLYDALTKSIKGNSGK